MAKDPAVLFYTSDFLTGTMTLSDEQTGKYIKLLCLQHQKFELTEKDMMNICKSYDEDIFSKFIKTDTGYYNERMREEAEKRKRYSESRSSNRKNHMNNTSKSYEQHMENEIEIVIKDENKKKKRALNFMPPSLDEVKLYFTENGYTSQAGEKAYYYYSSASWRDSTGKQVKNWKQKMQGVWFKEENKEQKQVLTFSHRRNDSGDKY